MNAFFQVGGVSVELFESGFSFSDWRYGEAAQETANRVRAERVVPQASALFGVVIDRVVVFGNHDGAWADVFLGALFVGRLKLEGGPWADSWKVWSPALGLGVWYGELEALVSYRLGWRLASFVSVVSAEWLDEQYRAASEPESVIDRALNIHGYDVFLEAEPVAVEPKVRVVEVEASAAEVVELEQELGPVSEWTADDQALWEQEVGWFDQEPVVVEVLDGVTLSPVGDEWGEVDERLWREEIERSGGGLRSPALAAVEEHDARIERVFFVRDES